MNEIMGKLQGLLSLIEQKIEVNKSIIEDNLAREKKLNSQDEELVKRARELNARELAIKPIENVVALKDQANSIKAEADALLHSVRKDRDEFNKSSSKDREVLAEEKRLAGIDRAKLLSEKAMIDKEWAVLKKEKAEYKDNLMAEIKKKIG